MAICFFSIVRVCVYLSKEPHQMWSASIRRQGLEKQLRREELLRLQLEENRKRKKKANKVCNMAVTISYDSCRLLLRGCSVASAAMLVVAFDWGSHHCVDGVAGVLSRQWTRTRKTLGGHATLPALHGTQRLGRHTHTFTQRHVQSSTHHSRAFENSFSWS